uniref:Exocyst complex component 2 n=1 Tax=Takifugu rubripes TaxID=31033 RepID=A0A674NA45_TAKRU
MSRARQPPLVTGISPKEGVAWTKVTIRGENLGMGPPDLIGLSICGHNCLLTAEWMSASKIVCRVGPAKDDKGEIIVTTKSGGLGTSTVSFRLLKPERIGILDQSAVWVDEMNYYDMRTNRNKGISPLSLRPSNPLGIELDNGTGTSVCELNCQWAYQLSDTGAWLFIISPLVPEIKNVPISRDFTLFNIILTFLYFFPSHCNCSFSVLCEVKVNAKFCVAAIHQRLESDGTERVEGSMTQRLENILNRASDTADTLFQEVLGRKDKADSTRNALNVLQRFKFLFNLPLNIERNIQKGDYDVVINDYEKAKSLFGNTEVPVFKKVYAEVETRIQALRHLLLEKLLQTPSTLHDQKRYIRYLSDLHAPGDPAWQCIYAQHKWILQLMQDCRDEFITVSMGALDLEGDARPSALGRLGHTTTLKRGGSLRIPRSNTWRYETPQQVQFVEKLSDVVIGQLPNFWKLWISYVNGSLFSETGEKSGQVEKSKKNARQRQNDFKKMIEEMTHRLVKLVRGALLPTTLPKSEQNLYGGWDNKTDLSGVWLTQIMHTIRLACHEALSTLEIPNDLLQVIQDLLLDLRVHCLMVTLVHTTEDVKRLAEKEDWVVDNEGITSLPSQFEQCLVQMLQSLKEPLEVKPGEINEQRLLIILSNCQYLERRTLLNLADHFEKHGFTGTEKITQVSVDAVRQLDRNLFEAYIERRADPISGSLEPGIYAGYFDWRDCQTPTGVRNYLKEALVNIITVHAEVFTVSKDLVPRVLSKIVESVADEMCRLMQCVSTFSKNGALQVQCNTHAHTKATQRAVLASECQACSCTV